MVPALALLLLLALEPPKSLSPKAGEHNTLAMQYYDAGQFGPAVDEFYAAYRSMPDARRDREGRVLLLGSMRSTLLTLHRQTGEPAPLCRLQKLLKEHIDALTAAYPEDPEMPETRSVRTRHEQVTRQLADISPTACEPPPPAPAPEVSAPPTAPAPATSAPALSSAKAPSPPAPDVIPPRQLKIAGGVTLGLSVTLLGVMAYGIYADTQARQSFLEIRDNASTCSITSEVYSRLQDLRGDALTGRRIAIATGIAAGVTAAFGGTLLGLARRSARSRRWSAAPWWSSTGAGLTVHVRLGAAR